MSVEIIRIEDTVDRDNNPEMFVQVQYTDSETGILVPFSKWLFRDQYEKAKTDPTFLNTLFSSLETSVVQDYRIENNIQNSNHISKRQARLVLLEVGLLETVNQAVAAAGESAIIEWEYADYIARDWPLLNNLAESLNISQQTLDELFTQARQL